MFRKLLSVGGFTLASRVTGFARDALLAWILGKGIVSDAFFVAFLFPNNFRAIFGEGTLNGLRINVRSVPFARGMLATVTLVNDTVPAERSREATPPGSSGFSRSAASVARRRTGPVTHQP